MVGKISEVRLSHGTMNDWFQHLGSVTNVGVDQPTAKTLVAFVGHDQVWEAWESEETIFRNWFVSAYWY